MTINFKEIKTPYLIAEVGINHNGDLQIAKRLIDAVFACQWDCVKFQKRDPEICVPKHERDKLRDTPWGKMRYIDYKHRMEFGKKEYDLIDKYCKEKSISWTASVWDLPSLKFILNYDIHFVKIPSAKLTDKELLIEAAKSGKPMVVSTGMSTIEEIDEAVGILEKYASQYILMHCNSAYPAPNKELNLKCIRSFQDRYKCPIGYSGHEYGLGGTILAVALGAKVIERHITLDHDMWGTDQFSSIEVRGMDMLRRRIKDVEPMLGDGKKRVFESEIPILKRLRKIE